MSSGQPSVHLEDPDAARRPRGVVQRLFRGEEVFFHSMRTVADIMTSELECLRTGDTVHDAAELLGRRHIHHVPIVVDALSDDPSGSPTLAGLVSQRDIARAVDSTKIVSPTPGEISGRSPLSRLMTRDLISVTAETKVTDAIVLMVERKVDCLPVLNTTGRGLQGIVTTTDVITSFLRMEALRKCRLGPGRNTTRSTLSSGRLIDALMGRVDDVMTTTLHELSPTDSVARAVDIIQSHRVRHVPVVDDKHRLLGVVTDRDIAAILPAPGPEREREPDRRGKFRARLFRIDNRDPRYAAALDAPVHRIMSPSPVAVAPGTPLVRLADLFSDTWLGYFPVVDRENSTLVGLVTQTDFLVGIMALSRLIQHGSPPKRAA